MTQCGIFSAFYYIENSGFSYKNIHDFLDNMPDNINFCSIDLLVKSLDKINTRLIDRQSLALEAALKLADDGGFFDDLNKSKLSIIAGSYSSSIYPSAAFNLSVKEKGANFVNATEFTNTVGNAAVSRACIWNQFRDEAYAISEGVNSGLNAIVDAYNNIKYGNNNDVLACATEEIGAAAVLIQKDPLENHRTRPVIAYIKNCDSNYTGNIMELKNYFDKIVNKFDIELKNTNIYFSGDFDKVNELFIEKNLKYNELINKNMLSLTPLINIGRCLYDYENGMKKDSLIFSVDTSGFVSSVLLAKGACQ